MSWLGVTNRSISPQGGGGGGGSPSFAPNFASVSSGMATLVDRQWLQTDGSIAGGVLPPASLSGQDSFGMTWSPGDGNIKPVIDTTNNLTSLIGEAIPAPPDGNSTVMAIKYPLGFPAGTTPFAVFKTTVPTRSRMYLSCYLLLPNNFNANGNNLKWLGIQSGDGSNHILMLYSGSGVSNDQRAAWLVTQGVDNKTYGGNITAAGAITALPGFPGSGVGYWNSNRAAWHCCEWFIQRETTPGVTGDGQFRAWFDGTLITSYANINFNATSGSANGFQTCSLIPYYGGGGSAAPADEYYCLGRFFVASGN